MSTKKPHLVILGGGYVAVYVVRALRRSIRRGEIDCTVVDQNNYHTFHGLIAETLVGKIQPGQILSPARKIFSPANFHNALIETVNTDSREIVTSRALDGKQYTLSYDYLVVSLGSVDNLSLYPGISEHAIKLKSYWDCFRLRSRILRMLEMAEYETDPAERKRLLTFVVAGGNYAGIEVASELIDYFRLLTRREYPRLRPEEFRVVVVHGGERILPELGGQHPRLVGYAQRHLDRLGLEILLKTRLVSATPTEVILDSGERIPTRTLISCTGTAASPLLDQLGAERDERGRVITESTCSIKGCTNVWTAGDCAAVPHPRGGYCPPLATYAMMAGRQIGRNIRRQLQGRPQRELRFTGLGDACALGGRRAVAELKGVPLRGFMAWILWRLFMLYYLPTWDRRIRLMSDWFLAPLTGRDIVGLDTDHHLGIVQARYEPGQLIVEEGDSGADMYIIQEGQVEVIQGGRVIGTLTAGSHFGEKAAFDQVRRTATVRARTEVQLLVVRREQARVLQSSIDSFEEIARTPNLEEE
jgi:NADH dehydrogenase